MSSSDHFQQETNTPCVIPTDFVYPATFSSGFVHHFLIFVHFYRFFVNYFSFTAPGLTETSEQVKRQRGRPVQTEDEKKSVERISLGNGNI